MSSMKRRALAIGAALGIILFQTALAAKAGYIEQTGDEAYHLAHLLTHDDKAVCICTADLVKVRIAPGSDKLHGRMMEGEQFVIIDSYKEWLRIEIIGATPSNPDSRRGMTGWVDPAYIDCGCGEEAYYAQKDAQ